MNLKLEDLLRRLDEFEAVAGKPDRFIVALSGGLDSCVLLHALAQTQQQHGKTLQAVHIDHQLHPDSVTWSKHCERVAGELGVEMDCFVVDVDREAGHGPEAAARNARYAALTKHVGPTDWLMSAHHCDDQAETLLINLLRGSGPAGVAGIPELRKFADGWLVRPLLNVSRQALLLYANNFGIDWIEDPSNEELRYDRNFLRHNVMPILDSRWPNVSTRLSKSAAYAREATELLNELADADLSSVAESSDRLDVSSLRRLTPARQKNVLRRAISISGLPPAPSQQLQCIVDEVVTARDDAAPLVCWQGAEVRRFRDRLYLLLETPVPKFAGRRLGADPVDLGVGLGRLLLLPGHGPGLSADCVRSGLRLESRRGGEKFKPLGQTHTRKLKKLLQEKNIVPWMRDRLPLVYSGERLVAVADLWIEADSAVPDGAIVRWDGRPTLH